MLTDRFAAQLLAGPPAADPVEAVGRLLAVQAQDQRGARLAVRARTTGVTAVDIDRALTVDRSLVISWLNRGTLHLVRVEDHPWLHALTAPRLRTGTARRLHQEGVSADAAARGVSVIERALAADGPLTRSALGERLVAAGVPATGQGLVHLLVLATIEGLIVRGPVVGAEQAFALTRDWLGPAPAVDLDAAVVELCRRYLAGHAPADERDLATWAGLPLGVVRAGLRAVGPDIDETTGGLVLPGWARPAAPPPLPRPRLLGMFDPVLHGWRDRAWVLGDHADVVTVNGIFRPIALADAGAVGTWTLPGAVVKLQPFAPLDDDVIAALEVDAVALLAFLGRRPGATALAIEDVAG